MAPFSMPLLLAGTIMAMIGSANAIAQGNNRPPDFSQMPQSGGIYRYSITQPDLSLDPVRSNTPEQGRIIHQIGDLLVDYDTSLTPQPELATRWEVSKNGLTYTYHLRRGVRFHDSPIFPDRRGRELKAADVKYCFERLVDARAGGSFANYFVGRVKGASEYRKATLGVIGSDKQPKVKGVSGFRVVDDYTFAIDLVAPYAPFKHIPALQACIIYPREAVEYSGAEFAKNLVATGPFMVDRWTAEGELVLRKNPGYWQKDAHGIQLPYLDGISIRAIPSKEQRVELMQKKELHEIHETDRDVVRSFMNETKRSGIPAPIRVTFVNPLSSTFYGMLATSPAFKDKRVRQAFNLAIDKIKINREVLQDPGAAPAIHGIVPLTMPGYSWDSLKGYEYAPEQARALMKEAGYEGGKGFPQVTLQINLESDVHHKIAVTIAEMLKETLGVTADVQTVTGPKHLELIEAGSSPFFRQRWIADYPDPEQFLQMFYSGSNVAMNPTRYSNRTFDSLYKLALSTQDEQKRIALYRQAEQVAVNDAPVLFLYHELIRTIMLPNVRGLQLTPLIRPDMKLVWLDTEENIPPRQQR